MNITREQLSNVKVPYGRLLVELDTPVQNTTSSGLDIVAYSDDTKTSLTARFGKVVYVNPNVEYPEKNLSFVPEKEVEAGDIVWWDSVTLFEALKQEDSTTRVFRSEDKIYVVIPYYNLVLRKRGEDYLGLNDKVVLRPIERDSDGLLDMSGFDVSKPRRDILEVVYVPSFKGRYKDLKIGITTLAVKDIVTKCSVGDKVHLMNGGSKICFLEDALCQTLGLHLVYVKSSEIADML